MRKKILVVLLVVLATFGALAATGQRVTAAAFNGSTHVEFCALAAFDAGAYWDGGSEAYSVYTLPSGTRAIMVENEGPNSMRIRIDGSDPVATKNGIRLGALGNGETAVADRISIDCETTACASVRMVAKTAAQASGACAQLTILK